MAVSLSWRHGFWLCGGGGGKEEDDGHWEANRNMLVVLGLVVVWGMWMSGLCGCGITSSFFGHRLQWVTEVRPHRGVFAEDTITSVGPCLCGGGMVRVEGGLMPIVLGCGALSLGGVKCIFFGEKKYRTSDFDSLVPGPLWNIYGTYLPHVRYIYRVVFVLFFLIFKSAHGHTDCYHPCLQGWSVTQQDVNPGLCHSNLCVLLLHSAPSCSCVS